MEVYATIFMIFVSHVLSSFTQTISSRQKDERHTPEYKFRTFPSVYFQKHKNDEENQPDTTAGYIKPFKEGLREKIGDSDCGRDVQYKAEKVLQVETPDDVKLQRTSRNLTDYNAFIFSTHEIESKLSRKNKSLLLNYQNTFPSIITAGDSLVNQQLKSPTSVTKEPKVDSKQLKKEKNDSISSSEDHLPEAWVNRSRFKYTTVRPWIQLCLTCSTEKKSKVSKKKCTRSPCPTNRKKICRPNVPSLKGTSTVDQPFLLYSTNTRPEPEASCSTSHDERCSTKAFAHGRKLRNPSLKLDESEKFLMIPRKKKRNYLLPFRNQLDILQSVVKRYKKDAKNCQFYIQTLPRTTNGIRQKNDIYKKKKKNALSMKLFHSNPLVWKKKKKKNLKKIRNANESDVESTPSERCKNHRSLKGIPSRHKYDFYNLPDLVNAQTIIPPYYFQRKPSLLLSCQGGGEVASSTTTTTSPRKGLCTTATTANNCSTTVDLLTLILSDTYDTSTVTTDDSNISNTVFNFTTFSYCIRTRESEVKRHPNAATTKRGRSTTGKAKGKIHFNTSTTHRRRSTTGKAKANISYNSSTRKRGSSTTGKPKEKIHLNRSRREYSRDSNKEKQESGSESTSKPLNHSISLRSIVIVEDNPTRWHMRKERSPKKMQPWDKFCRSSVEKRLNIWTEGTSFTRQSWDSACGYLGNINEVDEDITKKSFQQGIDPTTDEGCFVETLRPHIFSIMTGKSLNYGTEIHHRAVEEGEQMQSLNSFQAGPDKKKVLLLIRVPVASIEKNRRNVNLSSVLSLGNASYTNHIKSRSIFRQLLPHSLKKTTMHPIDHVLKPWEEPWKYRQDKFTLFTTSVKNVLSKKKTTPINVPTFNDKNVYDYIAETCPSCSKRKNWNYTTNDSDKQFDDRLYDEEVDSDYFATTDQPIEEPGVKHVSFLLKFPKVDLRKVGPPTSRKLKPPLRDLTVLHSDDSPPKYFVEVPELKTEYVDFPDDTFTTSLPSEPPSPELLHQDKVDHVTRKKPIILVLQPFNINGNNVYLPLSNVDNPTKEISRAPVYTSTTTPHNDKPKKSKPIVDGYLTSNGSVIPFALVPGFLAIHPKSPQPMTSSNLPEQFSWHRKPNLVSESFLDSYSKFREREIALVHHSYNPPGEKKLSTEFQKQKGVTTPMDVVVTKDVSVMKRPTKKNTANKSYPVSDNPSLIVIFNQLASFPDLRTYKSSLNEIGTTLRKRKLTATNEPLREYRMF